MTDPARMKELGCDRSCLYCLTKSSRELLSLGVDQITGQDDDEKICVNENIKKILHNRSLSHGGECTIQKLSVLLDVYHRQGPLPVGCGSNNQGGEQQPAVVGGGLGSHGEVRSLTRCS
jgi:hypothetical protein